VRLHKHTLSPLNGLRQTSVVVLNKRKSFGDREAIQ
jgi:hypothetical protein